jgi:hypothetical protein
VIAIIFAKVAEKSGVIAMPMTTIKTAKIIKAIPLS